MFSEAPFMGGWTMAGLVVVVSMGMAVRVVGTGVGLVVGAEELGRSWKGFSLSMRSVLVPDTGKPRSLSSSLSSAT